MNYEAMNRETLIKKWLDNELSAKELEAFKQLEDYEQLIKLSDRVQQFKAPAYDVDEALKTIMPKIAPKPKQTSIMKQLLRIAAIVVLGFSIFYYTTTLDTTLSTDVAQKTSIALPDASTVIMNAKSELTYNKHNWNKQRDISLIGEAYFKVTKGSSFNVKTSLGTVTVLGTQFKVKQRPDLFEVICYEGSVKVTHQGQDSILKPGDSFLILDGKLITKEKETAPNPSWLNDKSYFKSMPLSYVLNEFERQYNLNFNAQNIDDNQIYTGSFTHKDIDLALKSITLPLNLNYSIKNNTVVLSRE